jgi:hypothetical protein
VYVAKNYETDNGFTLTYSVALYIGRNGQYSQNIVSDYLLPVSLLPELQWFPRSCATKQVVARYVTLTLLSGDILQIAYPFRPGSANWFIFWEQLKSLDVLSIQGFGEKITDKYLRSLLKI